MVNIFEIKEWSDNEWEIFFNNLDIIRAHHNLKKHEFAERINVGNAYRTDRRRPSRLFIKSICNEFNVDEEWLSSDHIGPVDLPKLLSGDFETTISEKSTEYKPHGDPPQLSLEDLTGIPEEMGMGKAVLLLTEIYESKNLALIKKTLNILNELKSEADREKGDMGHQMQLHFSNLWNEFITIGDSLKRLRNGIDQAAEKISQKDDHPEK